MLGGVKMFGRVFVRRVVTAADVTAGAQIRRCSHSLPLLRHSSQPSALGVTLWMSAMWVQPFAILFPVLRNSDSAYFVIANRWLAMTDLAPDVSPKAKVSRRRQENRAAPLPLARPRRSRRRPA